MRRRDLITRIEALERSTARSPRRAGLRMAAWMILGYAGVGASVVLPLLPAIVLLAIALAFQRGVYAAAAVVLGGGYVWSAWRLIRLPTESGAGWEGHVLTEHEAPALHAIIDDVRQRLDGPRLDRILVDARMNASIRQRRSRWLFGRTRHELMIGLPLLMLLRKEQVAAIVAHEYGHLVGMHSRFLAHLYQMRHRFPQIALHAAAQTQRRTYVMAMLLRSFLRWYLPRFDAETFVLGRAFEYAADRLGASISSAEAMASALLGVRSGQAFLERIYWPSIGRNARDHAEPTGTPYTDLKTLRGPIDPRVAWWLDDALCESTGYDDTHPSLADRLHALGMTPATLWHPVDFSHNAASPELTMLARVFDSRWRSEAVPTWRQWRERWHQLHNRLLDLQRQAVHQDLGAAALAQLAHAQRELGLPAWRDSLDRAVLAAPRDHALAYERAVQWIQHGERIDEARQELERVADADASLAWRCHRILSRLAWAQGEMARADRLRAQADAQARRDSAIEHYLSELRPGDRFIAPELSPADETQLRNALQLLKPHLRGVRVTRKGWPPALGQDDASAPLVALLYFADSQWERLSGRIGPRGHAARRRCIALVNHSIANDLPFALLWHCVAPDERWPLDEVQAPPMLLND